MTIPSTEPNELRAGDQWEWTRVLTDYPASAWTLVYRFKNAAGGFEITATADGDTHTVSVPSATSDDYAAGVYAWEARVTNIATATIKQTVDSGSVRVLPTLFAGLATDALDARTWAQKTLDLVETAIQALNLGAKSYTIRDRSYTSRDLDELMRLRAQLMREVLRERGVEGTSYVRFQRA